MPTEFNDHLQREDDRLAAEEAGHVAGIVNIREKRAAIAVLQGNRTRARWIKQAPIRMSSVPPSDASKKPRPRRGWTTMLREALQAHPNSTKAEVLEFAKETELADGFGDDVDLDTELSNALSMMVSRGRVLVEREEGKSKRYRLYEEPLEG